MPDAGLTDGVTEYDAAFHDTYVRQQVVAQVTSSTRPTNIEGRLIYETDTDKVLIGTGAAWTPALSIAASTSYTPSTGNITGSTAAGWYFQIGKLLFLSLRNTAGTATASAVITLSLPSGMTAAAGRTQILPGAGASNTGALCYAIGGTGNVTINKSMTAAWTAGDSVANVLVTGFIEIA